MIEAPPLADDSESLFVELCRLISRDALDVLKTESKFFGKSKRKRKPHELDRLLNSVRDTLQPFCTSVHTNLPHDQITAFKGPSWAVFYAMLLHDVYTYSGSDTIAPENLEALKRFTALIEQHGQLSAYLAALAISDPVRDDPGSIVSLYREIANLKRAVQSNNNAKNSSASREGRSPLWSFLRALPPCDLELSAKALFDKTVTGESCPFAFKDDNDATITLTEKAFSEADLAGLTMENRAAMLGLSALSTEELAGLTKVKRARIQKMPQPLWFEWEAVAGKKKAKRYKSNKPMDFRKIHSAIKKQVLEEDQ